MVNVETMTKEQLAGMFDHTLLRADAKEKEFEKLCADSSKFGFKMVAVNSLQTAFCKRLLAESKVHVGAAISFPLGQTTTAVKLYEVEDAIKNGADEIDYVMNITDVKECRWDAVKNEMERIVEVCSKNSVVSKVIFENCYLIEDEIRKLAEIAAEVKPDFIKTSTGFGTYGAKAAHVRLMKETVGADVKVKAAGGIRDWNTCREMILAGAERIGTSSSIKILEEFCKERGEEIE